MSWQTECENFMNLQEGILKENEVIEVLNDKKVKDIPSNLRYNLEKVLGYLDDDEVLKCYKVDDAFKTDFVVECGNKYANISMKSGRADIVHNEVLLNFIDYLKEMGISQRTLDTICMFHYGDGTIDGRGKKRMGHSDVVHWLGGRIKEANSELNFSKDFVLNVVRRCVFKGSNVDNIEASAIYFGDVNYGVIATSKQIYKHIKVRDFDWMDNLHIGPLLLRPDARYLNSEILDERKRQRIVLYWANLGSDINFIAKRYNY